MQLNWTTYSMTRIDDGKVDCRLSKAPVPRYTWEIFVNSYTAHKSDYVARGMYFYHVPTTVYLNQRDANTTCTKEGGQLPVLFHNDTKLEFWSMMSYFGVQTTWVGAFRKQERYWIKLQNEPTVWILANGTTIPDTTLPVHLTHQCFVADAQSETKFKNSFLCDVKFPIICQRDY
ncbi:C-type lectin-like [Trinorchestia longiramus]|nr:C-type lectin-like [Trinorchestia longiramus]